MAIYKLVRNGDQATNLCTVTHTHTLTAYLDVGPIFKLYFTFFIQAFVCGPMEMVKTQMQVGGHNGPFNTISQIVKTCGLKGLTKGMGLTIAREVPGCGLYFGAYEVMVR